jgi:tRNA(Ile)-lysidine synthetase-like protein
MTPHQFASHISPTDTIVLAVSGGVDSMVLLDMVLSCHNKKNIIVAHFDHSLRWAESDADRELVASICKREDIILEVEKMDIASIARSEKSSLEAIARRERYRFLESVRAKYDAKYILTAHHADDQMETILLGMIKWGKVRGLSGMRVVTGHIFRPLLSLTKSDIYSYASEHSIEYHEDSTNTDTDYDRNRIRADIVPVLRDMHPTIHETIGELGEYMQELSAFLSEQVGNWLSTQWEKSGKKNTFLIADFACESEFFQREIISYIYTRAHDGSSQWLSVGLIAELIRFVTEGSNSYGLKEVKKLRIERRGEMIIIL